VRFLWNLAIASWLCAQLTSLGVAQVRDSSVEELIQRFDEKEVERRRDAAYELVRRGDHSDVVIAALGKASNDNDVQVRVQSLTGLARAGKKSEPVIPELLKCLRDRDAQVRFRAAQALGAIGSSAIEPLTSNWPSASNDAKIATAQAFAIIGQQASSAVPLMTEGLTGKDGLPRYAAEALVAISPQDEKALLDISDNSDAAARKVGITALAAIKSPSERVIQKLQKAASDSEPKIRETAIIVVAKSRLPIEEKSALIEAALVDPVTSVRAAAIVAMRNASLPADEFAQRIAARLQSVDVDVANAGLKAISLLGAGGKGRLPAIVQLASREGIDQSLVSQTLANFGAGVVPDLLTAIEKQPANEPVFSRALGLIGEPAVASLTLGMSSDVEVVRLAATRALGGVRPSNGSLLQKLVGAVDDKSAQVREIAVTSLIAAANEADFIKDAVLKATHDVEPKVREAAIQSLRSFKFTDETTRENLDRGLKDASPVVRSSALLVLSEMPKLLQGQKAELVVLVNDADGKVRAMAVQTIGKLEKKQVNETVVKACLTALGDSDYAVRIAATESVKSLGIVEPAVLEALGGNLVDDLALLRVTLNAISGFGDKASPMIETVSHLASHEKAEVRVAALNALSAIVKDPKLLAGHLTKALDDKEWEVRRVAGVALGKLGPEAKDSVPKLFRMLNSNEDRDFASSSLKEINTAPVEAIPLFIESLDSEERRTAFYAVTLLGKIGPAASEALPKLEAMLAKPSSDSGRGDLRKKSLVEAIAAIKAEPK
jgi:HEAT repeat protein